MTCDYSEKEIVRLTRIAIGVLQENDAFLLETKCHERAIAHKLAEYLQDQFPDWNVDCEYNLQGQEIKILKRIRECSEHKKTDRIFPDIIVHKRNEKADLLVIELKKRKLNSKCDIKKLQLFTDQSGDYHYALGLFVQFDGMQPNLKWFRNGRQID